MGDIFGSLLAMEATVAFFLESTFIAVWVFGWKKLSPRAHAVTIWLVAVASNISAFWILVANAWMQHPVGYVLRGGRAELASFGAVVSQQFAFLEFVHTLGGAYTLAGIFVMGVSAWHLAARAADSLLQQVLPPRRHLDPGVHPVRERPGAHERGDLQEAQPAKLAAMESHWETTARRPCIWWPGPDAEHERNRVQILAVPGALSLMACYSVDAR